MTIDETALNLTRRRLLDTDTHQRYLADGNLDFCVAYFVIVPIMLLFSVKQLDGIFTDF